MSIIYWRPHSGHPTRQVTYTVFGKGFRVFFQHHYDSPLRQKRPLKDDLAALPEHGESSYCICKRSPNHMRTCIFFPKGEPTFDFCQPNKRKLIKILGKMCTIHIPATS